MSVTLQPPPPPPAPVPAGWEGILGNGEEILWQGRPDGRISIAAAQFSLIAGGLGTSAFAVFWMVMASRGGGHFWMFGLILFFAGLGRVTKETLVAARKRRGTHYTLTNRRAIIATDLPFVGRRMQSYPITANTMIELVGQADLGAVNFAKTEAGNKTPSRPIGFEQIPDARQVYTLLHHIQSEAQ